MSSIKAQSGSCKGETKISSKMMRSKKKGGLANQNLLHALLPGAKVDKKKGGKISVNMAFSRERVVFNVGGTRFETYRSTLHSQPNSPLADDTFLKRYYNEDRKEYFFDRDPDVFKAILNYLRTGELHLPSFICGPAAREELMFWGVSDDIIQKCCWSHYNSWNSTLEALMQLERDRKGSMDEVLSSRVKPTTCWGKMQNQVWLVLNKPNSSRTAKMYGYVSLLFVLVSIGSFVIETHPVFENKIRIPKPGTGSATQNMTSSNFTSSNATTVNSSSHLNNVEFISVKVTHPVFTAIDISCLIFFTIEYITRFLFARRKFKFMKSMMGVVDILAIIPDYIQILVYALHPDMRYDVDINYISVLRVARVLRIFRLIRHVPGLWILIYTLKSSLKELLLMIVFIIVGMLIFSSLIYFVDDRDTFKSIPHSFWWSLITMTTVGYGDMYPVTELGYIVGSFTALSGLLMIGFSVPVLVNNFIMYYKHLEFALSDEEAKEKVESEEIEKETSLYNNNPSTNGEQVNLCNVHEEQT
ncbi:potassium voltage-gated channel protein Shaw-like [Saccostrea echinata]|uniref:potassium voltage-gated channel protein Shaw-like n=1 Tax=Saccostrea echinata TaxID=191078 RepID=UPI002A7FE36C|nr:potassium voltage-gated channel protein Shaw-like [Saccostrea echinata]XP_061185297.1 potassium voltage-gated channel protein Shaw-like [Saccostrea echinata]XP_061185298.1 potassium voltage-gated channel protein Shaw-like [Saccostrea echinata]